MCQRVHTDFIWSADFRSKLLLVETSNMIELQTNDLKCLNVTWKIWAHKQNLFVSFSSHRWTSTALRILRRQIPTRSVCLSSHTHTHMIRWSDWISACCSDCECGSSASGVSDSSRKPREAEAPPHQVRKLLVTVVMCQSLDALPR